MVSQYNDFVRNKLGTSGCSGISAPMRDYPLFPHQRDLTAWALRRGRAAIFADTGLGKSRMQLAWADTVCRETGGDVLILAPLAVAEQTAEEGASIGISVAHAREPQDVRPGITITNYDRIHKFDASRFIGVVLDESSIIKHHAAKTLQTLLDMFISTPYKLCATATPAPNDWTELGNHAQFLGVRSRAEMLAEFFVHDGGDTQTWRLKGHARQVFWRWVASWGAMVRSPADLSYDASAYELPPLHVHQHIVETEHNPMHGLFAMEAQTLMDRRRARRDSLVERVRACELLVKSEWAEMAASEIMGGCHAVEDGIRGSAEEEGCGRPGISGEEECTIREGQGCPQGVHAGAPIGRVPLEPWLIWCDLNAEQDALRIAFGDMALSVQGSDTEEHKETAIRAWLRGDRPVMISKVSILGFGLNFQHCARMAFVGVTDSFEAYYQAVRRCWRFGQKRPVDVHVFASQQEGAVVANLRRKEQDARAMADAMASETMGAVRDNVLGRSKDTNPYNPSASIIIPMFLNTA